MSPFLPLILLLHPEEDAASTETLSQRVTANRHVHTHTHRADGIYNLKPDRESEEIKSEVCCCAARSRQMGSEIRSDLRSELPLLFKLRWAAAACWCNSQTCCKELGEGVGG